MTTRRRLDGHIQVPRRLSRYLKREGIRFNYLAERDAVNPVAWDLIEQHIELLALAWRALANGNEAEADRLLAPLDEEWERVRLDLRWDWKKGAFVPDPTWG